MDTTNTRVISVSEDVKQSLEELQLILGDPILDTDGLWNVEVDEQTYRELTFNPNILCLF